MHKNKTKYCRWLILLLLTALSACSRVPVPETPRYQPGEAATVVRMQLLHTTDMGMLPLIRVQLSGGQPAGLWLLDTGSSHNLIDSELAARLALSRAAASEITTIGGRRSSTHYRLPPLQIGKLRLDGQSATALDLSTLSAPDGHQVSGVLGMPALANLVLTLDYQGRQVRLANAYSAPGKLPQGIPFTLDTGVPVARLSVGNKTGDFILDTGNATALVMLPTLRELKRNQPLHFVEVADLGGTIPTQLARLPSLTLGARQFRNIPVSLPLNSQHAAGIDGSLGNGILARQEVTFDFPRRRLLLQRFGQRAAELAADFGFLLAQDNRIAVINAHSPAALAGLRRGDRIVALDSIKTPTASAQTLWKLLFKRQQVQLTIARDTETQADIPRRFKVLLRRAHYLPEL